MAEQGRGAARDKTAKVAKRPLLLAALVVVFLLILGGLGYRWALKGGLATLIDMQGSVERDSANKMEQWIEAEPGDEFYGGDGARTAASETAQFRLKNGARLTLKPSSKIRFETRVEKNALGITVELGEVDVQTATGPLTIDSEFGPIQIFANSKLALKRNGRNLALSVELGSIQLADAAQRVEAGESVEIEMGGVILEEEPASAPSEPEAEQAPEFDLDPGDGVDAADLVVTPGDSFTVHDPSPPTRVGFDVTRLCRGKPARLTAGSQKTEAQATVRLSFPTGRQSYEIRCLDDLERVAASGSLTVMHDSGTRTLPSFAPSANVSTDGRQYTVLYQHRLPQVHVTWPNAPQASSYSLQIDGRTITTGAPTHTFNSLARGTHQVTFSAASSPPRKSRTTTISVVYDSQAPAARVAMPPTGYEAGTTVNVAGQALPGWTVSVGGKELEVDSQRRFSAQMKPEGSLPIAFSHPSHGTHYYLRRSKSSP